MTGVNKMNGQIILACTKCEYETIVCDFVVNDFLDCPCCGASMRKKKTQEQTEIATMKREIEIAGDKAIWESIEFISGWKARTKQRQIFFKAGGKIPNNIDKV